MRIDIDSYKANKSFVQRWFLESQKKGLHDNQTIISILATSTGCPCIVVAYWAAEISNWDIECLKCIESLIIFYGYSEILNKPANSPI